MLEQQLAKQVQHCGLEAVAKIFEKLKPERDHWRGRSKMGGYIYQVEEMKDEV